LTEVCLARLETIGRRLGAVVTVTRDLALKQARAAEAEILRGRYRGPLHGIPYGAKDLFATRGIPTTWGAEPYRDQVFDYDATVVRKLEQAGAILVAKLAMIELAGGMNYNNPDASCTGPCRTPWNPGFWSGGSSSGPGAAVAAGLVPFAVGSETSGSILCPASFCALTGLRPTYGRVSRRGAMSLSWTLDKIGPMCHTADDCGIVLGAIAGPDPGDPTADARAYAYTGAARPRRPFKLGLLKGSYEGAHPEVRANLLAALEKLRGVAVVERDVPQPDFPYGPAVSTILAAECASAFEDLYASGGLAKLSDPKARVDAYSYAATLATDYLRAVRLRAPMERAWGELFARFDALVAPGYESVAPPIGVDFDKVYRDVKTESPIPGTNMIGVPAICLPSGFGREGLPTSIQFIGPAFEENRLIDIAYAYQSVTDWHTRRPPHG
jgi:aspartyl-tRNA(Asn)/glutamyl-tRNA(Gln) amidotransferase subunit A